MKVKIVLALLVLAVFAQGCARKEPVAQVPKGDLKFSLTNFDGTKVSLSDFAGKIVVLEWTNNDCPFVKRHYEAGTMVETAKKFADKNVVWLAVNSTHYANTLINKNFARQYGMKYVLDDHEGKVGRQFKATRTPHMFVIDKQGKIVYRGAIDDDPYDDKKEKINYVAKALGELTAGKEVSTAETAAYGCTIKWGK